jgi:hypothetical protein
VRSRESPSGPSISGPNENRGTGPAPVDPALSRSSSPR